MLGGGGTVKIHSEINQYAWVSNAECKEEPKNKFHNMENRESGLKKKIIKWDANFFTHG